MIITGKWTSQADGSLYNDEHDYLIEGRRLFNEKDNWLQHLSEKGWMDFNDFMPRYFESLRKIYKDKPSDGFGKLPQTIWFYKTP
ncbi:MAG: hypothetical protein NT007_09750 [Candidatus Kapabacteria bacterium]|nr:hypothetical protein [Candidatus Kapabacteria bacterium]